MIKKMGTPFFIELNSHQKFFGAAGFVTKVVNLDEGTITTASGDAAEIMETVETPATSTVDAAVAAGAKQIGVQSGGGIADGMVFEDANGNKYYVEEIIGDNISLKFPLLEGIGFGDTLTQVGNTGIYKIGLTINTIGNFGVYVANTTINLRSKGIQYTIKEIVLEDVDEKLDDEFLAINTKLDSIQTAMANSDTEDFTVFSG